jgi:hypothetical protein
VLLLMTKSMRLLFGFIMFAVSVAASQDMTGREYFNELKAANAFNHFSDEYVCFHDDNGPAFATIAKGADMVAHGLKLPAGTEKERKTFLKSIFVNTYYKGVANGDAEMFEPSGTEGTAYSLEANKPMHVKMVYSINWTTGRYRLQVYALDHNATVPAGETSGKCELIHDKQ